MVNSSKSSKSAPEGKAASSPALEQRLIYRSSLSDLDPASEAPSGFESSGPVTNEEYGDALAIERSRNGEGLSVYVHLPFCPSRCLTCDNQTTINHDSRQIDRYIDGLESEIALVTEHLGTRRRLQQLHLGGGTPNYLSDLQLVRLIDILDHHFVIDEGTDASLEANAHRASVTQLTLLHGLGFRSINLALRDLDPQVQESLGRRQSLGVVRDVIESARAVGFTRVSTDLVFGLPSQTAASVKGTIEKLLSLDPDRVYCSAFARRAAIFEHQSAIDKQQLPSLGDRVAMFSRIVEGLGGAGYEWVGLDCFARPQDVITQAHRNGELHRNWIGYTADSGRSLIGFGSSAGSNLETLCTQNTVNIERWRNALEKGQIAVDRGLRLTPTLRERRHALSDLICNTKHPTQKPLYVAAVGAKSVSLSDLQEDGFVALDDQGVVVTESGRQALHQLWGDSSAAFRWNGFM